MLTSRSRQASLNTATIEQLAEDGIAGNSQQYPEDSMGRQTSLTD